MLCWGEMTCMDVEMVHEIRASKNFHYMCIKNMSRLLRSQLTNSVKHKEILYNRCLKYFQSKVTLQKRLDYCEQVIECRTQTPDAANRILRFQNLKSRLKFFSLFMKI